MKHSIETMPANHDDMNVSPLGERTSEIKVLEAKGLETCVSGSPDDSSPDVTVTGQALPRSAEPPTVINLGHPTQKAARTGRSKPTVQPKPENPAVFRSSRDIGWSTGRVSVDNAKSAKWGLSLIKALQAQGIGHFEKGDLVTIEAGVGTQRSELTGRASRKGTAYFWIDELTAAGINVHQTINLVIVKVERAGVAIYWADIPQIQTAGGASCP